MALTVVTPVVHWVAVVVGWWRTVAVAPLVEALAETLWREAAMRSLVVRGNWVAVVEGCRERAAVRTQMEGADWVVLLGCRGVKPAAEI